MLTILYMKKYPQYWKSEPKDECDCSYTVAVKPILLGSKKPFQPVVVYRGKIIDKKPLKKILGEYKEIVVPYKESKAAYKDLIDENCLELVHLKMYADQVFPNLPMGEKNLLAGLNSKEDNSYNNIKIILWDGHYHTVVTHCIPKKDIWKKPLYKNIWHEEEKDKLLVEIYDSRLHLNKTYEKLTEEIIPVLKQTHRDNEIYIKYLELPQYRQPLDDTWSCGLYAIEMALHIKHRVEHKFVDKHERGTVVHDTMKERYCEQIVDDILNIASMKLYIEFEYHLTDYFKECMYIEMIYNLYGSNDDLIEEELSDLDSSRLEILDIDPIDLTENRIISKLKSARNEITDFYDGVNYLSSWSPPMDMRQKEKGEKFYKYT
jgi:hypothetical protein